MVCLGEGDNHPGLAGSSPSSVWRPSPAGLLRRVHYELAGCLFACCWFPSVTPHAERCIFSEVAACSHHTRSHHLYRCWSPHYTAPVAVHLFSQTCICTHIFAYFF